MTTETRSCRASQPTRLEVDCLLQDITDAGVRITYPRDTRNFLLAHPHVSVALPAVIQKCYGQLGRDTELFLEVDTLAGSESPYLVLLVRRPEYDQTVIDVTDELTMSVLQGNPCDARFLVRTDFVLASTA